MKRFFLLLPLFLILTASRVPPQLTQACPAIQAGTVEAVMPSTGYDILSITYPCAWDKSPVLVASPGGQGSFTIERFETNPLTGREGSIAVMGTPGMSYHFDWIATLP